jgi:hypothetical protein
MEEGLERALLHANFIHQHELKLPPVRDKLIYRFMQLLAMSTIRNTTPDPVNSDPVQSYL